MRRRASSGLMKNLAIHFLAWWTGYFWDISVYFWFKTRGGDLETSPVSRTSLQSVEGVAWQSGSSGDGFRGLSRQQSMILLSETKYLVANLRWQISRIDFISECQRKPSSLIDWLIVRYSHWVCHSESGKLTPSDQMNSLDSGAISPPQNRSDIATINLFFFSFFFFFLWLSGLAVKTCSRSI